MAVQALNAELLARMVIAGAQNLDLKKDWINELNVFPVPDGDTGTNMTMTIMSAVREIQALPEISMKDLCKAVSSGSLRGARGNSGVILSQLFRGFTKTVRDREEINVRLAADACERAVETAYKAVIKPKEGTILTVAKSMAEMARRLENSQMSMEEFMEAVLDYGRETLAKTPEMLPVLKEAGVVDSGGQGLIVVLEGAYEALLGKEIRMASDSGSERETPAPEREFLKEEEILFGYCTEFIIDLAFPVSEAEVSSFRKFLESEGDSIVLVPDTDLIKVHVHTNDPGRVISRALSFGSLSNIKIDNMRLEHREKVIRDSEKMAHIQKAAAAEPPKQIGFISVCAGKGFSEIFRGLNVDVVIEGGQTMNPSTEDLLNAIDQVNAENVFLYPNNKNIIMAANQARELVQEKNIIVIPTTTVPQGISALLSFDPESALEENQESMRNTITHVRTGEITYAVRDTHIDNVEIHQGDIMAVGDKGLLSVGTDIHDVAVSSVERMMFDEAELISVYYGKDFSAENAERLAQTLSEKYPDCDVEVEMGGQPVYYCILAVE